jgi:hypothetical protein
MSDNLISWRDKILVPVLTSLIIGFGTGYLGAERAIAVLEERVDRIEYVQNQLVEQQKEDGKTMVRIETKLDMLLSRTVPAPVIVTP